MKELVVRPFLEFVRNIHPGLASSAMGLNALMQMGASDNSPAQLFDELKERAGVVPLEQSVVEYSQLREVIDTLDEMQKALNKIKEFMQYTVIPDEFESREVDKITVAGHTAYISADMRCSIVDGKKPAAYQWLRDNGRGDLIVETVNSSTLASSAKAALKQGEPLPDELFKQTPYRRLNLRKA
jgi:hypothetical protein